MATTHRSPEPDIAGLTMELREATAAVAEALRAAGENEDDREVKNAEFVRLIAERKLAAAQRVADEKERLAQLAPSAVVDAVMGR